MEPVMIKTTLARTIRTVNLDTSVRRLNAVVRAESVRRNLMLVLRKMLQSVVVMIVTTLTLVPQTETELT